MLTAEEKRDVEERVAATIREEQRLRELRDYENKLLKEKRTYYCDNTYAYIMDREDSIDIDYPLDFKIAEFLMNSKYK